MLYRLYLLAVCIRDENYGERSWKSSGFIHPCTNVLYFGFCRQFISMIKIYMYMYKVTPPAKAQATHQYYSQKKIKKNRKESLSSQSDITQESTLISHPRAFSWLLKCVSIFGHNFHIIRKWYFMRICLCRLISNYESVCVQFEHTNKKTTYNIHIYVCKNSCLARRPIYNQHTKTDIKKSLDIKLY